jgi:hypothetical protein
MVARKSLICQQCSKMTVFQDIGGQGENKGAVLQIGIAQLTVVFRNCPFFYPKKSNKSTLYYLLLFNRLLREK